MDDPAGLAPLTALTQHDLCGMQVGDGLPVIDATLGRSGGAHGGLVALLAPMQLFLCGTQIADDLAGLAPLTLLPEMDLNGAQLAGALESLTPLAALTQKVLYGMQAGVAPPPLTARSAGATVLSQSSCPARHPCSWASTARRSRAASRALRPSALTLQVSLGVRAGVNLSAADDTPGMNGNALAGLVPLVAPTRLDPFGAQVAADIAGLAPLLALAELDLCGTQGAGGLAGLALLTALAQQDLLGKQAVVGFSALDDTLSTSNGALAGLAPLRWPAPRR